MTTCIHCGQVITHGVSWPSGRKVWRQSGATVGTFCEAVAGNPHEPATGIADEAAAYLASLR